MVRILSEMQPEHSAGCDSNVMLALRDGHTSPVFLRMAYRLQRCPSMRFFLLLSATWLSVVNNAAACSELYSPHPNIALRDEVLPTEGSTAPADTRIFVARELSADGGVQSASADAGNREVGNCTDLRIYMNGNPITFKIQTWRVSSPHNISQLLVLEPNEAFVANADVEVRCETQVIRRFSIAPNADASELTAPEIASTTIQGSSYGCYSCGDDAVVTLQVADSSDLLLVSDTPPTASTNVLLAVGTGSGIRWNANDTEGKRRVYVTRMTLSGKMSASTEKEVEFPQSTSGCSTQTQRRGTSYALDS